MLLLLTLARRNPTLLEVVLPDLNRTFAELRDRSDIALLRAIWMLTMRLGIETANAKLQTKKEQALKTGNAKLSNFMQTVWEMGSTRLGFFSKNSLREIFFEASLPIA
jgi:hypothetical protein